jgi:hypothetical protein
MDNSDLSCRAMRICANCSKSLEAYRRQARYCGGPCRAEASRARAAQRQDPTLARDGATRLEETALNRTQSLTGGVSAPAPAEKIVWVLGPMKPRPAHDVDFAERATVSSRRVSG